MYISVSMSSINDRGGIYLVWEREFVNSNSKIYKIGHSQREIGKRMAGYPKDSELLYYRSCERSKDMEKDLLAIFRTTFKQETGIGQEYFSGDIDQMIDVVHARMRLEKKEVKPKKAVPVKKVAPKPESASMKQLMSKYLVSYKNDAPKEDLQSQEDVLVSLVKTTISTNGYKITNSVKDWVWRQEFMKDFFHISPGYNHTDINLIEKALEIVVPGACTKKEWIADKYKKRFQGYPLFGLTRKIDKTQDIEKLVVENEKFTYLTNNSTSILGNKKLGPTGLCTTVNPSSCFILSVVQEICDFISFNYYKSLVARNSMDLHREIGKIIKCRHGDVILACILLDVTRGKYSSEDDSTSLQFYIDGRFCSGFEIV